MIDLARNAPSLEDTITIVDDDNEPTQRRIAWRTGTFYLRPDEFTAVAACYGTECGLTPCGPWVTGDYSTILGALAMLTVGLPRYGFECAGPNADTVPLLSGDVIA
jgi:hypothetical protein